MHSMPFRSFWLLVPFLLLVPAGCKRNQPTSKDGPVPVQVFKVGPASITRGLEYDADVKGILEVKVFSQVPERIVSLKVEPGDTVKKGQVLAVVRADTLTEGYESAAAAIDAAKAERDSLKAELDRQIKLLAKRIVSQSMVDQMRAKLDAAEAQIRRLEAMARQASTVRGNAVVRSPISGVIGQRFLEQGDLAVPSVPICTVVQMGRLELLIEAPERDLASIRQGMAARVTVARYPKKSFTGTVDRIYPVIDRRTRTAQARVILDNPEKQLMPGMLARVRLEVERHERVAVVPYSSLIIHSGAGGAVSHLVYVVEAKNGAALAQERKLEIGIVDGPSVEITKGLAFGDELVTRGQHLLRPGRAVRVVERLGADRKTVQIVKRAETANPVAAKETSARAPAR